MRRRLVKESDLLSNQKSLMRVKSKKSPEHWELVMSKKAQILALYHYYHTQVDYKKEY